MRYKIALVIFILLWLFVIEYVWNWMVVTLCANLLKCL